MRYDDVEEANYFKQANELATVGDFLWFLSFLFDHLSNLVFFSFFLVFVGGNGQ